MAYDGPWEPKSKTLKSMPLGLFLLLLGGSGPSATWGAPLPMPVWAGWFGGEVGHAPLPVCASCLKNTDQVLPVAAKARRHMLIQHYHKPNIC